MRGATFGAIDIFSLVKYDGTDMVFTDGVVYVKFYVLLLGASLGSLYGL